MSNLLSACMIKQIFRSEQWKHLRTIDFDFFFLWVCGFQLICDSITRTRPSTHSNFGIFILQFIGLEEAASSCCIVCGIFLVFFLLFFCNFVVDCFSRPNNINYAKKQFSFNFGTGNDFGAVGAPALPNRCERTIITSERASESLVAIRDHLSNLSTFVCGQQWWWHWWFAWHHRTFGSFARYWSECNLDESDVWVTAKGFRLRRIRFLCCAPWIRYNGRFRAICGRSNETQYTRSTRFCAESFERRT